MLIASYAGCGKSTAAQKLGPNAVDLPSMPYRLLPRVDPSCLAGPEMEREKGALHHIADPRFPHNYVLDILKEERTGKTVLFPTIVPVIDMLVERYGRDVLVVYPEDGLKEEYRQRFVKRGNSATFLDLFVEGWEYQLEIIKKSKGRHLRLKSGEYLLSVLPEQLSECSAPVSNAELAVLEREITEMGEDQTIWMWTPEDKAFACPVEDLDAPNVRETMDSIGKAAYERGLCPPRIFSEQVIRRYELIERVVWFKTWKDSIRRLSQQEGNDERYILR